MVVKIAKFFEKSEIYRLILSPNSYLFSLVESQDLYFQYFYPFDQIIMKLNTLVFNIQQLVAEGAKRRDKILCEIYKFGQR